MAIEFRTGEEITKKITGKDLEKLTMMLNDAWGSFKMIRNPQILLNRFRSGQLFVVGYDNKKKKNDENNNNDNNYDNKPISILETMLIRNDKIEIPTDATYDRLTNQGLWISTEDSFYAKGKHEILVLVDITSTKGYGSKTLQFAINHIAMNTNIEHVLTFSPYTVKVQKWHIKLGAELTENIIKMARPGYCRRSHPSDRPEDVNPLSYSKLIKEIS
ncbi:MAG: hypothetical protein ABH824_04330 [Nanoarchaeota archaeon]|nr:hypothetical protein [Nanoarchaeota archaeon]MBU1632796.1 hypothetical protein [Nanoarchaeota archaeon]MBU1876293.1 hypothetical protein [Nanoarchaeota archaeon]